MKTKYFLAVAAASLISLTAIAQDENNFKFYGFITNYLYADTHTSNFTEIADLFYYLPKDSENNQMTFNYANLASRLGVDVSGYEFNGVRMGAKVETDFYAGLSGSTGAATVRLLQAYLTLGWTNGKGFSQTFKMGQAWHPLAADMPETVSFNVGSPFNPFSRTPLAQYDVKFTDNVALTAAAIWQMQYSSCGPEGASANYIRYCGIPELYLGVNFTSGGFLGRAGVDFSSIRPYRESRISYGALAFAYVQYKKDKFTVKAKSVFGNTGSQMNLGCGYAVVATDDIFDLLDPATYNFTATRHSTSWLNISYGKKIQASLFAGYMRNFGTDRQIASTELMWFNKNSDAHMNRAFRVSPQIVFNWGKLALALEVEHTAAQYGKGIINYRNGLYENNLHWTSNTRIQSMLKFTF